MTLRFERLGLDPNFVSFTEALERQNQLHAQVVAGEAPNTVLMVEHEPVYTAGRQAKAPEYPYDGTPVVEIARGGKVTYHGPGMLVAYPIMKLPTKPVDVVAFVREIEKIIINVIADFGVTGHTVEGRTGVWIDADSRGPERKVSAIGVGCRRLVTMHGVALNCSNDLRPFGKIIPCGIADAGVTTISQETGKLVTPSDVIDRLEQEFQAHEERLCIPSDPALLA